MKWWPEVTSMSFKTEDKLCSLSRDWPFRSFISCWHTSASCAFIISHSSSTPPLWHGPLSLSQTYNSPRQECELPVHKQEMKQWLPIHSRHAGILDIPSCLSSHFSSVVWAMLEDAKENESFGVSMSLSKLIVAPFLTVLAAQDRRVCLREVLRFGVLDVQSVALLLWLMCVQALVLQPRRTRSTTHWELRRSNFPCMHCWFHDPRNHTDKSWSPDTSFSLHQLQVSVDLTVCRRRRGSSVLFWTASHRLHCHCLLLRNFCKASSRSCPPEGCAFTAVSQREWGMNVAWWQGLCRRPSALDVHYMPALMVFSAPLRQPFRKKPNGPQTKSRPFSLARRNQAVST